MKYLGHRNAENNAKQILKAHLMNVSKSAEKFASEFGENEVGKIVGLYHDIGKYSCEFQKYIRNESKNRVDHSTAGARELFNTKSRVNLMAAFCIAGHHGGLKNIGNPKITDGTTFFTRIKKEIPNYEEYSTEIEKPTDKIFSKLLPKIAKNYFDIMFYTHMIFSCLVDADFLDTENFMTGGKFQRGNFSDIATLKKLLDDYIKKFFLIFSAVKTLSNTTAAQITTTQTPKRKI